MNFSSGPDWNRSRDMFKHVAVDCTWGPLQHWDGVDTKFGVWSPIAARFGPPRLIAFSKEPLCLSFFPTGRPRRSDFERVPAHSRAVGDIT